jgi:hypothetical protein
MRARMMASASSRGEEGHASRWVMAEATVRESSSKTLAITCCSRAAARRPWVPASVMARMSSLVMPLVARGRQASRRDKVSVARL